MEIPGNHQIRTITRLQETKRGRMAVFFDDAFDFSVDKETFVKENLRVGKRFTEQEYEQLRHETQYMKAKEKAFSLLSYKSWTRKLLAERLEQEFSEDCVQEVLDRIEELGLINDADYAVRCARDLVGIKHYALSRVRQELAHRGVGSNDIEDALSEFDDLDEEQAIRAILEKKFLSALREEKGQRRAFNALVRLGYDVGGIRGQISRLVEQLREDDGESEDEPEEERDISGEIRALLLKKYANAWEDQKGKDRAIRGMMRRGYNYSDIRRVLEELMDE